MQRAKTKGGLAEHPEKERIERCRDQRQREGLLKIQRRREWKGEMQKAAAGFVFRNATLGLWLKHFLFILFFLVLAWLNRFGSVQSVSDFRNRNRTEPELFCDFLIG
jgi:hypothetical protein